MTLPRARTTDPKRKRDILLLRALLEHADDLREEEAVAFADMLSWLDRKVCSALSERQRSWVEQAASRLEIEVDDPAERNKDVPRGREVAPAPVLRNLPKAPPGRARIS